MRSFKSVRRSILPVAALVTAAGLIGCTTVPAPTYTTTSYYPQPYYSNGYSVTTTNYPRYPLYSPYYKGYGVYDENGSRG
jgi:hypothetical protein